MNTNNNTMSLFAGVLGGWWMVVMHVMSNPNAFVVKLVVSCVNLLAGFV